MSLLKNSWLGLFFRIVLGGVFIYASLDKILHPEQFARIIFNSRNTVTREGGFLVLHVGVFRRAVSHDLTSLPSIS